MNNLTCYIDGACSNNPGTGGWGVFCIFDEGLSSIFFSGSEIHTTNNRMELQSAIYLTKYISKLSTIPNQITIYTDSQYLKNGITEWIYNWQKNNWKNSAKKPVKNVDLWQELVSFTKNYNIKWQWVKGHSNDIGNDIADSLATLAIKARKSQS